MAIRQAIWKVGQTPSPLQAAHLPTERLLEDVIVSAPASFPKPTVIVNVRDISSRMAVWSESQNESKDVFVLLQVAIPERAVDNFAVMRIREIA
jgi:hypothetical protein